MDNLSFNTLKAFSVRSRMSLLQLDAVITPTQWMCCVPYGKKDLSTVIILIQITQNQKIKGH